MYNFQTFFAHGLNVLSQFIYKTKYYEYFEICNILLYMYKNFPISLYKTQRMKKFMNIHALL